VHWCPTNKTVAEGLHFDRPALAKLPLQRLFRKLMWRNKEGWVEGLSANF